MANQEPDGPPPVPGPVGSNITWMTIVGAVFAAILLVFFLFFGGYAAINPEVRFNCTAFSFLAVAFAIGSAASASFLGGGAAIEGKLGVKAMENPLRFSLIGGGAVLAIMLLLFLVLRPDDCSALEEPDVVKFESIPESILPKVDSVFWARVEPTANGRENSLEIMVPSEGTVGSIYLMAGPDVLCRVVLKFYEGEFAGASEMTPLAIGDPGGMRMDFALVQGRTEQVSTTDCLAYEGRPIPGLLTIIASEKTIFYRPSVVTVTPTADEFIDVEETASATSPPLQEGALEGFSFVAAAHAQDPPGPPPDFASLATLLSTGTDSDRLVARQELSDAFTFYRGAILQDLNDPARVLDPNLTAGLLSALIAGIEQDQPALMPQAGRSLNVPIAAIAGMEGQFFALLGHRDPAVRQQARRLVQRYPVDLFEPYFQTVLDPATPCTEEVVQGQIYASVFYDYNRMIQEGLNQNLDPATAVDWQSRDTAIKARVAECVTSIERVDAALLDYGLATVMTWSPDISEAEARAAARGFFDTVGDDASSYYFQSHVTKMQGLIAN